MPPVRVGGNSEGLTTGRLWSVNERGRHINCLELLAAILAVKTFAKSHQNVTILLRTDNIPTRAYINHFGGTHSHHPMNALAMDLWKWCIERQVAEHLEQSYFRHRIQNCEAVG